MVPLHLFVASILGWLQREQHEIIFYLREENPVPTAQLRNSLMRIVGAWQPLARRSAADS